MSSDASGTIGKEITHESIAEKDSQSTKICNCGKEECPHCKKSAVSTTEPPECEFDQVKAKGSKSLDEHHSQEETGSQKEKPAV